MAYLYKFVNTKYKRFLQTEKEKKEMEIRKEMVRELVKFTRVDLQVQIVQSIEYARKKKKDYEIS
jgi:hypothetical protein